MMTEGYSDCHFNNDVSVWRYHNIALIFGTRLPLVHGSSFMYLAPALVIMNSREYQNLTEHVSDVTYLAACSIFNIVV